MDRESTEVVRSNIRLDQLKKDYDVTCSQLMEDSDRDLLVTYRPWNEPTGRKQSIIHAILTTAYARVHLYDIIRKYPEEVVYFDTDSVFLLLPEDKSPPATSSQLGELKDEIKKAYGVDARITCFASIGTKSYAYRSMLCT